jgi:hypothetical protein
MSTFNPNEFFNSYKYYSISRTLYYRNIKEPRCDKCKRLNPNWEDIKPELPTQGKKYPLIFLGPEDDCIEIPSTPPALGEPSEGKISSALPPPTRRGANYISNLAIGVRERRR